ncbi:MAG: recombinase family protein [Candidatus Pacearchaeota archaeon]|nr:recombinase family protein [Candidatus Pacearchaeota archaeon]
MKCIKCSYDSEDSKKINEEFLCEICRHFAPDDKSSFEKYIEEKVDQKALESFRKYSKPGEKQKKAMVKRAIKGNLMSRAPFGYKIEDKKLIPAENSREIEEIFEEFVRENISLNQLAEKHHFSVNGLKKILRNFTYIGKIKFNNQIYEGSHMPIISSTLFNHVQNKIERLGIK